MIDLLAKAKQQLDSNGVSLVEATIEFALADIATHHHKRSAKKSWRESYNYAASVLAPDEGAELTIKSMKKGWPPILSVSNSADITEVSRSHFINLLRQKDPQAVIQGLVNLERWREDNSEISSWAKAMVTSLVPYMPKDDSSDSNREEVCICTQCGTEIPHIMGVPCTSVPCPSCAGLMLNKGAILSDKSEPVDVELDEGESPKPLESQQGPIWKCPECGLIIPATPNEDPTEEKECPKCPGVQMTYISSEKMEAAKKTLNELKK